MSSPSKNSSEGAPERCQESPSKGSRFSRNSKVSKAESSFQKFWGRIIHDDTVSGINSKEATSNPPNNENLDQSCMVKVPPQSNETTSDSQHSSPNNENPNESETDKDTPSKGGDGKTKTFKPKELTICLGEDSQYWKIPEGDGPAEMVQVCWLDVSGEMDVTEGKTYEVSFMLSMNTDESFGWENKVFVMARIGEEGKYKREEIDLSNLSEKKEFPEKKFRIEFERDTNAKNNKKITEEKSRNKRDEIPKNIKGPKLYFGLYEVWSNNWKGGLLIHEAIVRELTTEDSASTSNTRLDDSKVLEITAGNSTSTSKKPPNESEVQEVS